MAKTDQERMGLFSEMGYTSIGDPYKSGNVDSKRRAVVVWCVVFRVASAKVHHDMFVRLSVVCAQSPLT